MSPTTHSDETADREAARQCDEEPMTAADWRWENGDDDCDD